MNKHLRIDAVEPPVKVLEQPIKLEAFADKLSAWQHATRLLIAGARSMAPGHRKAFARTF
ncbi:hypothetical protein KW403_07595 [Nitratireductor kimnyeongensis]|nr:hypothetical protein [Nitratireductor kimnyeongensis]QZZ36974.1 hypothetical protein KW403_07595 [Nitratireductor kimnyeongensis]